MCKCGQLIRPTTFTSRQIPQSSGLWPSLEFQSTADVTFSSSSVPARHDGPLEAQTERQAQCKQTSQQEWHKETSANENW